MLLVRLQALIHIVATRNRHPLLLSVHLESLAHGRTNVEAVRDVDVSDHPPVDENRFESNFLLLLPTSVQARCDAVGQNVCMRVRFVVARDGQR